MSVMIVEVQIWESSSEVHTLGWDMHRSGSFGASGAQICEPMMGGGLEIRGEWTGGGHSRRLVVGGLTELEGGRGRRRSFT